MKSFSTWALLAPLLLAAPSQCPSHREPPRHREEPPGEAVYRAACHLRQPGFLEAANESLRYVIVHYPQSRWAERARQELEAARAAGE